MKETGLLIKANTPDNEVFFLRDGYRRVIQERQGEHSIDYQYDKKGNSSISEKFSGSRYYLRKRPLRKNFRHHCRSWRNPLGCQYPLVGAGNRTHSSQRSRKLLELRCRKQPCNQIITRRQERTLNSTYGWNANQQLQEITNDITGGITEFGYNALQSLAWAQYEDGSKDFKMPDEVGNIFRTKELKDCIYGKDGKIAERRKPVLQL